MVWREVWLKSNREVADARSNTAHINITTTKDKKHKLYKEAPKLCACGLPIPFDKRKNKYCSQSCAAHYTNINRDPRSDESRKKTSASVRSYNKNNPKKRKQTGYTKNFRVVCFHPCTVCGKIILSRSSKPGRKTCSEECRVHASVGERKYINGRRLNIYYTNPNDNTTVLLESSWELEIAKFLDENNIRWIRPKFIRWFDETTNKNRLYYPDFYLPDLNLYLDPKNPTAVAKSEYKMSVVSKLIPLVYGGLDLIKETVLSSTN